MSLLQILSLQLANLFLISLHSVVNTTRISVLNFENISELSAKFIEFIMKNALVNEPRHLGATYKAEKKIGLIFNNLYKSVKSTKTRGC